MSSCYGENIHLSIFGQSHSEAIGMTLDGLPAGLKVDLERLNRFLARRAPGNNDLSTPRKESDAPEFLSGIKDGHTCGAPVAAVIRNTNTKSADYSGLKVTPRPGHADYTAEIKYHGSQDHAGGGHFSGRLTAPMCIAGGLCLQFLEQKGIHIFTRIYSIGNIKDSGDFEKYIREADTSDTELSDNIREELFGKPLPVLDAEKAAQMRELILSEKAVGDSVGGIIECVITGLPAGLGDPMFDGMENRISQAVFAIPAVKGIEFGAGFAASGLRGSENNDPFRMINGRVVTSTNNSGGILGGISNGMPIVFKAAFKPTPSIAKEQQSVDLNLKQDTTVQVHGRHDPCIVPRALPCVEAAAALAVYDALLAHTFD